MTTTAVDGRYTCIRQPKDFVVEHMQRLGFVFGRKRSMFSVQYVDVYAPSGWAYLMRAYDFSYFKNGGSGKLILLF